MEHLQLSDADVGVERHRDVVGGSDDELLVQVVALCALQARRRRELSRWAADRRLV
jgi:hypothetical protein